MLTSTCAIFGGQDMDRCAAFYSRLGFELQWRYDAEGYLIFIKDKIELHLARNPDHKPELSQSAAYIRTDSIDDWSDQLAQLDWPDAQIPRFDPASDRPWGMREMHIIDPDGNLLRVGQYING